MTTFLLADRYAEARARYHSSDALCALLELGAKEVIRAVLASPSGNRDAVDILDGNGSSRVEAVRTEEHIGTEDLMVEDLFLVWPSEKVAVDGVAVEGRSAMDASLFTGESAPAEVETGQAITGVTVNIPGILLMRATAVSGGTTLVRISRMVAAMQAGGAPAQRLAGRISGMLVPIVLVLSTVALAGWLLTGYSPQAAFTAMVAVLVVTCSCAPGLAMSTALLIGPGRATQLGVVIKGPEMLESTRAPDTMIMDETGTVTQGRMNLEVEVCQEVGAGAGTSVDAATGLVPLGDEALRLAGVIESALEHPAATAITATVHERLGDLPTPIDFSDHEGRGVSVTAGGRRTAVGRPGWLAGEMGAEVLKIMRSAVEKAQDSGVAAVVLAVDESGEAANVKTEAPDEAAADSTADTSDDTGATAPDMQSLRAMTVLAVRDVVRPFSWETVVALRELGIRLALPIGDNTRTTEHAAAQMRIGAADVCAEMLPIDKRDVVADLQTQGAMIGMVGDRISDAAALAQTDTQRLGFAMDLGANMVIEAVDIILVRTDLGTAVAVVRVPWATLWTIRQNLFQAFAYNTAVIPLAAVGLFNPMIAGVAMVVSSVIAITSSLRLRRAG